MAKVSTIANLWGNEGPSWLLRSLEEGGVDREDTDPGRAQRMLLDLTVTALGSISVADFD